MILHFVAFKLNLFESLLYVGDVLNFFVFHRDLYVLSKRVAFFDILHYFFFGLESADIYSILYLVDVRFKV